MTRLPNDIKIDHDHATNTIKVYGKDTDGEMIELGSFDRSILTDRSEMSFDKAIAKILFGRK